MRFSRSAFPVVVLLGLLAGHAAQAELYLQKESRSPNGRVVFAINYPPTGENTSGLLQGCFLNPETGKRIGEFFNVPNTEVETDHPGTYPFDYYNVFDYVWSVDSTHIAIVHNLRHFGYITPYRRRHSSFEPLAMPDVEPALAERLTDVLQRSIHIDLEAQRWTSRHHLVVRIARGAQVKSSGTKEDWREYSLTLTLSFNRAGKPAVLSKKLRIKKDF